MKALCGQDFVQFIQVLSRSVSPASNEVHVTSFFSKQINGFGEVLASLGMCRGRKNVYPLRFINWDL